MGNLVAIHLLMTIIRMRVFLFLGSLILVVIVNVAKCISIQVFQEILKTVVMNIVKVVSVMSVLNLFRVVVSDRMKVLYFSTNSQ